MQPLVDRCRKQDILTLPATSAQTVKAQYNRPIDSKSVKERTEAVPKPNQKNRMLDHKCKIYIRTNHAGFHQRTLNC